MNEATRNLEEAFQSDELADDDREAIVDELMVQLSRLNPSAHEELLVLLGVRELTRESVIDALKCGAFTSAITEGMVASGFSLFIFGSLMLKAVAILLLHHSLHFGAFMLLSKTLGIVVHHPIGVTVTSVAIGGIVLSKRGDIDRRVAALAIMTVLAAPAAYELGTDARETT